MGPAFQARDEALHEQREWLRVTLASIGDAVIMTDTEGKVTFLNSVAESLTGWTQRDAVGESLETVFKIINEENRQTVECPAVSALREGIVEGLASHTLLVIKDGTELPVDDSAAPNVQSSGYSASASPPPGSIGKLCRPWRCSTSSGTVTGSSLQLRLIM